MSETYIEVKTGQCKNCHAPFGYLVETHSEQVVSEFDKCLCGAEELQQQYEGRIMDDEEQEAAI